ncbi:MAG: squalene/phytoene synthase family protein [Kofleriaceae bacterium]|nr:squalene/phytoene synthase family protein [Myxococcales bacterium]MCB9574854.1 squalene/phytoene synthase family protein [Kofleriaceae bacterium]
MIQRIASAKRPAVDVPLPPSLELDACYRYCEALCKSRHHNFPVASFFARSSLRKHIWAIFAFARVADDFADEPAYEGRRTRELDRWEEQLHACYFSQPPQHPVFVALADTIKRFDLPITEFAQVLSGFRTDLEVRRMATFNDLRSYTAQAAEPVAHLWLYIAGYRAPELHAFADDLATGLAIARLLQDIPADLERGRIYVPQEDLRHFGVTEDDLAARRTTPALAALVRYEVARTRALFERARPLVERVGPDLAVELALMWHGGMRILDKIGDAGAYLLEQRPRLDAADKAVVVTRALAWRGETLGPRAINLARRLSAWVREA